MLLYHRMGNNAITFIMCDAHDRGTRLYWAGLCRRGGGTGGFGEPAVKRKEGPEVAEAREGRGSQNRDCHQCQTDKESRQSPEPCCDDQKNTVDPQSISKFDTGEGQIRQHGDSSIEEDFRGGPVKTDSNVTD